MAPHEHAHFFGVRNAKMSSDRIYIRTGQTWVLPFAVWLLRDLYYPDLPSGSSLTSKRSKRENHEPWTQNPLTF